MNANERTGYLKNLLKSTPDAGSKNIAYKAKHAEPMGAYKIDLDYLVYNQFNGRIGTLVKAHTAQFGSLDTEKEEDKNIIEGFLWNSQVERNKRTKQDLSEKGQLEPGIVTLDGVIIDGNRRASLLAQLAKEKHQKPAYFNAVILPEPLGASNAREIKKLETQYQMGMDEKLGYNALEKYLQLQDLVDSEFTLDEIAGLMNQDIADIEKWWEVKQLMDKYLEKFGYDQMYTRLDRAEDWFWKLQESRKRFDLNKSTGHSKQVDWSYRKADVNDLTEILFDYIRASREAKGGFLGDGQSYRDICSAGKNGFFKNRDIWKDFRTQHFEDIDKVSEESIDDYRRANPGEDATKLLQQRDKDFFNKVENQLKANFGRTSNRVQSENDKSEPKKLLEFALQRLEAVDPKSPAFKHTCENDSSIKDILVKIGQLQWDLKKSLESIKKS